MKNYIQLISEHYNDIRNRINVESLKSYNTPIDEDIFHDTLLKMNDRLQDRDLDVKDVISYIFVAYKMNFLRDKQYARNKYNSYLNDIEYDLNQYSEEIRLNLDYYIIREQIIKKFGINEWKLFSEYINGEKISSLEKTYKIKGLRYKFKKIKTYIKKLFEEEGSYDKI